MGVEEAADKLVVGVAWIAEASEEFSARSRAARIDGFRVTLYQALHFGAGGFRLGDRREAREPRHILAEVSAGTEIVIPTAHVLARGGESGALAVDFQKAVFTEVEEEGVVLVELALQGARQEINGAVRKRCQVGADASDYG